jgi:hypothetical protein
LVLKAAFDATEGRPSKKSGALDDQAHTCALPLAQAVLEGGKPQIYASSANRLKGVAATQRRLREHSPKQKSSPATAGLLSKQKRDRRDY